MASSPLKNGGFLTIFGALTILHFWDHKIQTIVPEPYLVCYHSDLFSLQEDIAKYTQDEFFHVRQAKLWIEEGQWDVWDPKITTPPGL